MELKERIATLTPGQLEVLVEHLVTHTTTGRAVANEFLAECEKPWPDRGDKFVKVELSTDEWFVVSLARIEEGLARGMTEAEAARKALDLEDDYIPGAVVYYNLDELVDENGDELEDEEDGE